MPLLSLRNQTQNTTEVDSEGLRVCGVITVPIVSSTVSERCKLQEAMDPLSSRRYEGWFSSKVMCGMSTWFRWSGMQLSGDR